MLAKPRAAIEEFGQRIDARIDARLDAIAAIEPPPVFLSVGRVLAMSVPMQTSTCVSLVVHAFLILIVGFIGIDPRSFAPPHNIMDVVLVNAKSNERPLKADALAQANLDGGGNTDEALRAKTPLPAIEQSASRNEVRAAQERVKQLEQEMKTLMTQVKSSAKVLQGEVTQEAAGSPNPISASDMMEKTTEIARLEAAISREYEQYQQRPKRKFIGARTTEYRFAQYVDTWRLKIERVGNLNYPEEAKVKKIYGALQLTVAIKADGEVEDIQINRSSGQRVLDEAAKRIVRLAAPYDRFPDNIRRDTDILHITRTWMFTRSDTLTSE
jgi:periplasmic protein TonB